MSSITVSTYISSNSNKLSEYFKLRVNKGYVLYQKDDYTVDLTKWDNESEFYITVDNDSKSISVTSMSNLGI